jgi:hypothetical protein
MNQRMMIGAVVLLIAASGVVPQPSPEMATLTGNYTLMLNQPDVNQRLTLVLGKDGSATLTAEALGENAVSTTESGVWTIESGVVKLALTASSGTRPRQMTLSIQEDSLVGLENDSTPLDGENWTFRRR